MLNRNKKDLLTFTTWLKRHNNLESAWHNFAAILKHPLLYWHSFTAILKHPLLYMRVHRQVEGGIDPYTGSLLYETVLTCQSNSPNIIEVGAWKGRSTVYLSLAASKVSKRVKSFELFSGLPTCDPKLNPGFYEGQFSSDINEYEANVNTWGRRDSVDLVVGDARQTMLPHIANSGFSIAFLDVDVYEVMRELLFQLWSIAKGNEIVIIHDFNAPGVRNAVRELQELSGNGLSETHLHRNTVAKLVVRLRQ